MSPSVYGTSTASGGRWHRRLVCAADKISSMRSNPCPKHRHNSSSTMHKASKPLQTCPPVCMAPAQQAAGAGIGGSFALQKKYHQCDRILIPMIIITSFLQCTKHPNHIRHVPQCVYRYQSRWRVLACVHWMQNASHFRCLRKGELCACAVSQRQHGQGRVAYQ